jgi:hypothetical protein
VSDCEGIRASDRIPYLRDPRVLAAGQSQHARRQESGSWSEPSVMRRPSMLAPPTDCCAGSIRYRTSEQGQPLARQHTRTACAFGPIAAKQQPRDPSAQRAWPQRARSRERSRRPLVSLTDG